MNLFTPPPTLKSLTITHKAGTPSDDGVHVDQGQDIKRRIERALAEPGTLQLPGTRQPPATLPLVFDKAFSVLWAEGPGSTSNKAATDLPWAWRIEPNRDVLFDVAQTWCVHYANTPSNDLPKKTARRRRYLAQAANTRHRQYTDRSGAPCGDQQDTSVVVSRDPDRT